MGFKTWLESVEGLFDEEILEGLINEQPHTIFRGQIPPELAFLHGRFVDLGFENLGLSKPEQTTIFRAFASNGVVVPGSNWRLRNLVSIGAMVEPVDGSEQATLPTHWKQAVMVLGFDDKLSWVGKLLRPNQLAGWDLSGYRDTGDGLVPPDMGA